MSKLIDNAALKEVSSAKRSLVGVDVVCQLVIDLTALRWALFEILHRANCH